MDSSAFQEFAENVKLYDRPVDDFRYADVVCAWNAALELAALEVSNDHRGKILKHRVL